MDIKDLIPKMFADAKLAVTLNNAKLAACSLPHDFAIPLNRLTREELPAPMLFCRWKCRTCGGIVDGEHRYWYNLGLAHRPKC